jgi:hypothetical protein
MSPVPNGFRMRLSPELERLEISYRTHGMGCMVLFLEVFCLWFATFGVGFLIFKPEIFKELWTATWWTPIALCCGGLAFVQFGLIALFHRFGETRFVITRESLTVTKELFGLKKVRRADRSEMKEFAQIKDGGGEEDSFPSWALVIRGKRTVNLLSRQRIEKSDWLGKILSEWFELPYHVAAERE